jgi:hypothetical protein
LSSIDIFENYIKVVHGVYPRAVEIVIGIIGNMASLDTRICEKILLNQNLVSFMLETIFYDLSDTQTLIQLLRLFNVFLLNEQCQKDFLNRLDIDQDFISFINFILEQSLNRELLDLLIEFLINLFDMDEKCLEKFAPNSSFLVSLLNSADFENDEVESDGLNLENVDLTLKNHFVCLQLLSTCEAGVQNLCLMNKSLLKLFTIYIEKFLVYFNDDDFDSNVYFKNEIFIKNFICFFSVFNLILENNFDSFKVCEGSMNLIQELVNVSILFLGKFEKIPKDELKNYKLAFDNISIFSNNNHVGLCNNVKNLLKYVEYYKKLV